MPIYEYRHTGEHGASCSPVIEVLQSMQDERLTLCPHCGLPVERQLAMPAIATPKTASELKNLGFTKLVRRDEGVYENVTRTGDEKRYMTRDDPSSVPNLKGKISD